mmetsp:Transcript_27111/g.42908  ORF Transcript_27111/g.42908 Transcript_27111/m.42908 type:complete len:320 (+) Transcript_27111:83-1042(+)|eukprot:CAMPEP_0197056272 /NCGR_PEP_ID=MMETSP1384-20130603/81656_1 /TAXON_ID=29189 /ORGANISM="Ammonia sp." /LENGTH=319 /DNA_ID=CAMNT_0042490187 /DNA_START=50 /DNA_END=1009 /DNA_ORIENTATION=+
MGLGLSNPSGAELLNAEKSDDAISGVVRDVNVLDASSDKLDQDEISQPASEYLITPHLSKSLGEPVVEVRDICKQFTIKGRDEVIHALKGVTLATDSEFGPIRRGEFVMIRGPSGGGKTTLLNMLGTLDYPSSGSIEILGSTVTTDSSDRYLANLRLRKIGFVFQTFNLISTMSAFENVELPMIIHGTLSKQQCKQRAIQLLELVGLGDRLEHLPSELSGGEQQRVTIARALANKPEILLLDEPTGDLDTRNTIEVMDLLLSINLNERTTCIMVTHNNDLEVYADRILYVKDGTFQKQAINKRQTKLELESYLAYINQH